MKSIAIIGGGFSGTLTAINLARLSSTPLEITVVNQGPVSCRGAAYGTRNSSHLLNVAARNMSALADQPNHFVEWLGTRSEYLDESSSSLREKFVPRQVYGDYLQSVFHGYATSLPLEKGTKLQVISGEVVDVVLEDNQAHVKLGEGREIKADKVVLATGNQPPADIRPEGLADQSPLYIGNPWRDWERKLPSPNEAVLLVGTGLTMVDTVLSLQDLKWQGKIFAVSRNGLLPLSHFKGFDYPDFVTANHCAMSLRHIFSIFKQQYREAKARNLNPAILVDKLRPFTQRIWQNFSVFEKRQFNRHFRTRWNVTRHRIAPEIHGRLQEAITQGRLEIIKGKLSSCVETENRLKVRVDSHRGPREIEVGVLINCTGPQENCVKAKSTLFQNLFARGTIQPDALNMGIQVASNFAVLDAHQNVSENLFAMGALLKGTLWETTAVPELRSQAFRLAETIARQLAADPTEKSLISEVTEDVLEYSI
ncbi:MAG TPA: FAD/NAD(P)-binding protein [Candidatus Methylacidiphilales bacterium]